MSKIVKYILLSSWFLLSLVLAESNSQKNELNAKIAELLIDQSHCHDGIIDPRINPLLTQCEAAQYLDGALSLLELKISQSISIGADQTIYEIEKDYELLLQKSVSYGFKERWFYYKMLSLVTREYTLGYQAVSKEIKDLSFRADLNITPADKMTILVYGWENSPDPNEKLEYEKRIVDFSKENQSATLSVSYASFCFRVGIDLIDEGDYLTAKKFIERYDDLLTQLEVKEDEYRVTSQYYLALCDYLISPDAVDKLKYVLGVAHNVLTYDNALLFGEDLSLSFVKLGYLLQDVRLYEEANIFLKGLLNNELEMYESIGDCIRNQIESPIIRDKIGYFVEYSQFKSLTPMIISEQLADNMFALNDTSSGIQLLHDHFIYAQEYGDNLTLCSAAIRLSTVYGEIGRNKEFETYLRTSENLLQLLKDEAFIQKAISLSYLIQDQIDLTEQQYYVRKLEKIISTAVAIAQRLNLHQEEYELTHLLARTYLFAQLDRNMQHELLNAADSIAAVYEIEKDRSLDLYHVEILINDQADYNGAREIIIDDFGYYFSNHDLRMAYINGIRGMNDFLLVPLENDNDYNLVNMWIEQLESSTEDEVFLLLLKLTKWDIHLKSLSSDNDYHSGLTIIPEYIEIESTILRHQNDELTSKYLFVGRELLNFAASSASETEFDHFIRFFEPLQWEYEKSIYGDTWFINFVNTGNGPFVEDLYNKYTKRILTYSLSEERVNAKMVHGNFLNNYFGKVDESILLYEETLQEAKTLGNTNLELEILTELGALYLSTRQFNIGHRRYLEAIELTRSLGLNQNLTGIFRHLLGDGLEENHPDFYSYASEYHHLSQNGGNYLDQIQSIGHMIGYFQNEQLPDSALKYIIEGISIKDSIITNVSQLKYLNFLRDCFDYINNDMTGMVVKPITDYVFEGIPIRNLEIEKLYDELIFLKDFDLSTLDHQNIQSYPFIYGHIWTGRNLLKEYWDGEYVQSQDFKQFLEFLSNLNPAHADWGLINSIWYIDTRIKTVERQSLNDINYGFTYKLDSQKHRGVKVISIEEPFPETSLLTIGDVILVEGKGQLSEKQAELFFSEKLTNHTNKNSDAKFKILREGVDTLEISVRSILSQPNIYSKRPREEIFDLCKYFFQNADQLLSTSSYIHSYPSFANTYREFIIAYPHRYKYTNLTDQIPAGEVLKLIDRYEQISTYNLINETMRHRENLADNPMLVSEYIKYSDKISQIQLDLQQNDLGNAELERLGKAREEAFKELHYFERYALEKGNSLEANHNFSFEHNAEYFRDFEGILRMSTSGYLNNGLFYWGNYENEFNFVYTHPEADIKAKIKYAKSIIEYTPQKMIDESELQNTLIELTEMLFKFPLVFPDNVKETKIDWLIIPEQSTYLLPFELLQFRFQSDTTTYHYLGEYVNISYAPSLSSYVLFAQNNHKERSKEAALLVAANPKLQPASNYTSNLFALRSSFGNLDYVDNEIDAIGQKLSSKKLFRKKINVKSFTSATISEGGLKSMDLGAYKYIHIAAHGVLDSDDPQYSGILLGQDSNSKEDGIFQAHEIFLYNLKADLVTLSSCFSGFGDIDPNEGSLGIYRSFMIAGAKSVIISLWNVEDESTSILFSKFYEYLKDGYSKSEALRLAKLFIKNETEFSHPFYWAPFILMGES
jgi:CHAT domain-containing protein